MKESVIQSPKHLPLTRLTRAVCVILVVLGADSYLRALTLGDLVAQKLAEKAAAARDDGQVVRPFLLYSEAVKRSPDNQSYRQNRDSLAQTAALMMKTQLERVDIKVDVMDAEFEAANAPLPEAPKAAQESPPTPEPVLMAEAKPSAEESAAPSSASVAESAIPEPVPEPIEEQTSSAAESNLPADFSMSVRARQDSALSVNGSVHLTENRTYSYLDLAYNFWSSADGKYRIRFGATARGYVDSVFDLNHFYPANVSADEHYAMELRRAVLSFSGPSWTVHIGRQQVVWGEAVGMFIADVVNPKDYRQFLVPDMDDIRIPLKALDAQKDFGGLGRVELFWSPDVQTSRLPIAGSEFAFNAPAIGLPRKNIYFKPASTLANSSTGIRYSKLTHGWDTSVFYLRSISDLPAVSTSLVLTANPFVNVVQRFPMTNHFAATVSKPVGDFVLKSEAIYSRGSEYQTASLGAALRRDTFSGMFGFSYPLRYQYMLDIQYFQTSILADAGLLFQPGLRSGFSVRVADVASLRRIKPSIQTVASFNQHDYWISPKLTVRLANSLFTTVGFDWFAGSPETQFGQFHDASRLELSLFWKANYTH